VVVRPARSEDAEAMAALYVAAARAGWPHIYGAGNLAELEPPVEGFRAFVDGPGQRVLVAEHEGAVAGFALVRPSPDEDAGDGVGELDMLYTDPAVWGQGAGQALLRAALAALREDGRAEATLWTAEDNHRPRRIYERAGWLPDGTSRERVWRGVPFRELRYRIRLAPD
jgi:ribosomal protein S18 acetylase RimI-like enzyme